MASTTLIAILAVMGLTGEIARLLLSNAPLTARQMIGRAMIGVLVSEAVLSLKVHRPDIENLTLVGVGAVVAVLGYSFLEPLLKQAVRSLFKRNEK
ncbi:TPA: hypothetical protein LVL19_003594 [Klebsiella michiganensis]|nr:hypothetical protein [Klebsiella michiganensis]